MRTMHNVENINESRRKCALCTYESSKEEMLFHFQEVHDVKIENVELSFDFETLNESKDGTEKETKTKPKTHHPDEEPKPRLRDSIARPITNMPLSRMENTTFAKPSIIDSHVDFCG
ncbi:hypothetical protein TNCV_961591 [Trichonephila clavipes]|nr:hypothetical protein TNCV_961591 [Trichonephila clavipes]